MTSSLFARLLKPKPIFILALLLRLSLAYFQYSGDVKNHLVWAEAILLGNINNFYQLEFPGFNSPNYPPLTIYLFALNYSFFLAVDRLVNFFNQTVSLFPSFLVPFFQTENAKAVFLKLPAILADIGIGYLLYLFIPSKYKTHIKVSLVSLYLFNPAVIYISSVWGQIESIPIFFLLLSLYYLTRLNSSKTFSKSKKLHSYFASHICFTLAILSKQTALWLAPFFIFIWLKLSPAKFLILGLAFQLIVLLLLYAPFNSNLLQAPLLYLSTLTGSSNLVSNAAWNFWHFIYPSPTAADNQSLLFFSVRFWSITILVAILITLLRKLNQKFSLEKTFFSLAIFSFAAFFFQTRVHERHLAPFLVFLLLFYFKSKSKSALIAYFLVSGYHMLNLYLSLNLPFS